MGYKPVGVDDNGYFPPRVTTAMHRMAEQRVGKKQRALRQYHAALANINNAPLDVFFPAGDSLYAGNGLTLFGQRIDQKFALYHKQVNPQVPVGGLGLLSAFAPAFSDSPVSGVASAQYSPGNGVPGWGIDSSSALVGNGKSRIWTFDGTGFDLQWFSQSTAASSATLLVNGTNYVYNSGTKALTPGAGNILTALGATSVLAHGQVRGLVPGSGTGPGGKHVITLAGVSGPFYFGPLMAFNGDEAAGVRVTLAGSSGKGTRNYVGAAYGTTGANPYAPGNQAEQWLQNIVDGSYLPDLVCLDNYANDYTGSATDLCSVAENLANHRSIIAKIKAAVAAGCTATGQTVYVPSFVEMPPHCVATSNVGGASALGGTMVDIWQNYVANAYILQATDPDSAVAVFDLGERLQGASNTWDNVTYNGLLGADKVHPSPFGTDWWMRALVRWLAPE